MLCQHCVSIDYGYLDTQKEDELTIVFPDGTKPIVKYGAYKMASNEGNVIVTVDDEPTVVAAQCPLCRKTVFGTLAGVVEIQDIDLNMDITYLTHTDKHYGVFLEWKSGDVIDAIAFGAKQRAHSR